MKAVHFPDANTVFGKPTGWDENKDGVCESIPAFVHEDEHNPGKRYVVVAWKPSEKDMAEFAKGKPVYLQMWSGLLPHCLYTIDDENNPNYE